MELRHLRSVVTLAEELHFGRAARRLNISQPPLSLQIQRVEEELGVKLFHRTKRSVVLLDAGAKFAEDARRILADVDNAARAAVRASQGEIGHLTVATVTAEKKIVVEALRLFRKQYPDVHVELRSMSTPAQLDAIRENRLDVGFVILPVDETTLAVEKIAAEPLVVALPPAHRLAKHRRLPLAALAGEPSILFPRPVSPGYYDLLLGRCRQAGFSLHIVHEADDIYTALALVQAGFGVSLFPASIRDGKARGLVFREINPPALSVECAVVYRREPQPAVLRSFLTVLRHASKKFLQPAARA